MCLAQVHLKRMLAFATVGHMGVLLCGIALLDEAGLAGVAVFVVGDGLVKAALFVIARDDRAPPRRAGGAAALRPRARPSVARGAGRRRAGSRSPRCRPSGRSWGAP